MDSYFLTQVRLNTLVKATPWLKFSAQFQDARTLHYDKGQPTGSMHDQWICARRGSKSAEAKDAVRTSASDVRRSFTAVPG